jgi:hypothetical protein
LILGGAAFVADAFPGSSLSVGTNSGAIHVIDGAAWPAVNSRFGGTFLRYTALSALDRCSLNAQTAEVDAAFHDGRRRWV